MAQPTKMIVGLGNPGAGYSFNRHNVGFMAADALAYAWGGGAWQKKFKALCASATHGKQSLLLLKPATYMNLSGEAAIEALNYYKLATPDVIAFHDDIDLPAGHVRIKQGGGHGGHNGLRSLDAHIGKDYWRVRIGVGRPERKEQVSDYVLSDFAKADRVWLEKLIEALPEGIALFLDQGAEACLKRLAQATGL